METNRNERDIPYLQGVMSDLRRAQDKGKSRDQTRVARARWAEISLKMHARWQSGRLFDPSTSLRMTN